MGVGVLDDGALVRMCAEVALQVEFGRCSDETPHGGFVLDEDGRVCRVDRSSAAVRLVEWNPLRRDAHAMQVVDHVARRVGNVEAHCFPGDSAPLVWMCAFVTREQRWTAPRNRWPWVVDSDRRRAFVLAALRAVGAPVP